MITWRELTSREGILSVTSHVCLTSDSDMILWVYSKIREKVKNISWVMIFSKIIAIKKMDANKNQTFNNRVQVR